MMTRKYLWLVLCAAILCFSACQKAPELAITSPSSIELSADGSSGTISFTANRDWKVSSSDSWVIVSPSSGTATDGPITINVSCAANTTYDDRTATVTIKMEELSQTVTVRQPANLGIVLPTQSFDLQSDSKTIEVEVQANVQYTVSTSANWIKQTGTKGLTSKKLTFSIAENKTYDPREGKITIKPQQGNVQEQVITIRQAQKDALNVEKTSYEMPYGGGGIEIKVEANVSFDVSPNVDWIHYVETKALSSSTIYLTVDENETYSAREGKIEISQKNGTLKHTVTVKQAGRIAVASVELNKTELRLEEGATESLTATVKPDNATDKTVTWSSSDENIATVDASGKVTAVKKGAATITAQAGEKAAKCSVTVFKDIPVTSIELDKTSLSLVVGDEATLNATVKPDDATDKTVTWSSSNSSIATVDANGKVTAVKEGSATITANTADKSATCIVTVSGHIVAVTEVILNRTALNLKKGESETLTATVKPNNATDKTVTWSTSDATVATVENGTITAIKEGTATITAKAGEKIATCIVTVSSNDVPDGAVDLGIVMTRKDGSSYRLFWAECNIGASTPEGFGEYYAWGETETKESYSWETYKWANGALNKLTKYCPNYKDGYWDGTGSPDDKTELEPEDDVAHMKLGGNWRMPTDAEWDALRNSENCTWTWTTQNGVNGRLVTSTRNGNSIFFPAAGYKDGYNLLNLGSDGYYWSSSLLTNYPYGAWHLYFDSTNVLTYNLYRYRLNGLPVRPVTE